MLRRKLGYHRIRHPEKYFNSKVLSLLYGHSWYEVGGGDGRLTRWLVRNNIQVKGVFEIQHTLFHIYRDLDIPVLGDVLTAQENLSYATGNLPYRISSQIIFHAIDRGLEKGIFMIQRELAYRFTNYSKIYWQLAVEFHLNLIRDNIPPSAFIPKPKVYSSIVFIHKRKMPLIPEWEIKQWRVWIKYVFKRPNKISAELKSRPNQINNIDILIRSFTER